MRYIILISAVLMQMCLGATYSWSVYVQSLKDISGLQQGPVQIPFTVFYFVFPLTMMIAGSLLSNIGPRRSGIIGGLLFGGGWLVASLGAQNFMFTILGIGIISGVGAGLAYIVPIAVCIRWFPENKGMVTGVAVAGFGGGAALVSQLGGWMMKSLHLTPFQTFMTFGFAFLVLVTSAAATMKFPAHNGISVSPKPFKAVTVLSQAQFRLLYFAMFTGLAAGFAINANLKELFTGVGDTVQIGITAVSLFALANAAGRIIWGAIFDRVESVTAIQANLFLQAIVLFMAPVISHTVVGYWALALATGFNYGGVLVIYVASATRCWGAESISKIYGWLFSSNIIAAISPIIAGMFFDRYHTFQPALFALGGLLIVSGLVMNRSTSLFAKREVVVTL